MKFLLLIFILCATFESPAWATPDYIGQVQTYSAHEQDTLADIAQRYNLGYIEIIAANPGVDPWLPGEGTEITLPLRHPVPDGPHEGLVINLGTMRMFYYPTPEATPESFAIGIGREGKETPLGQTTITRKTANPVWHRTPGEIADKPELPAIIPAGPDNPLGAYALYLGWPGYLIHGTDDPRGIGRLASRGCMRMYPQGIQELYDRVPPGTKVTVVDQPIQFLWIEGQLYASVFPSRAQANELEDHNSFTHEVPAGFTKMVLAAAGADANRLDWDAVRQAANDRKGFPVQITK